MSRLSKGKAAAQMIGFLSATATDQAGMAQ
jgi:hypothetical protein